MTRRQQRATDVRAWALAVALLAGPILSKAEVIRLDASIKTQSVELINGQERSSDEAFEEFAVTSSALPLQVQSNLMLPTRDGSFVAMSSGFADFREPRLGIGANPSEFGLEAICYSVDPEVGYRVNSKGSEARGIRFSRRELLTSSTDPKTVISTINLSGLIIAWTENSGLDLTGLDGSLRFIVEQVRTSAEEETGDTIEHRETVYEIELGVEGVAEGFVHPFIAGVGSFLFGGPELVQSLVGPNMFTDAFGNMGNAWVMVIPEQVLPYAYQASVDEEFDLVASLELNIANVPDGTGIAAVFGRGFEGLAGILDQSFSNGDGSASQKALNDALSEAPAPEPVELGLDHGQASGNRSGMCGALGADGLAALLPLILLPALRMRPRISRQTS